MNSDSESGRYCKPKMFRILVYHHYLPLYAKTAKLINSKLELIQYMFRAWGNITPEYQHKRFSSKPGRVRRIIRSRSYPTKYYILRSILK